MHNRGFTLNEVLLSIAIIAAITMMSMPIVRTFMVRNELDITTTTLTQMLRRASTLAEASDGDSNWGVSIQGTTITLYKGKSFAARDVNFDEVVPFSASVVPSGSNDISFTKFTGLPQSAAQTVLTSTTNETRTISINSKGAISF